MLRQTAAVFSVECQRAHSLKAALSSLLENKIHLAPGICPAMPHMFRALFGQQGNAELEKKVGDGQEPVRLIYANPTFLA